MIRGVLVAFLGVPSLAMAQPVGVRVVSHVEGSDRLYDTAPAVASLARHNSVVLSVAILQRDGSVLCNESPVRIDGHVVMPRGPVPRGTSLQWHQIEPRREHIEFAAPNPGTSSFSNAVLFGPRHGHWLGYDHLEYTQSPVTNASEFALHLSAATPLDPAQDTHHGAGSTWFAATVTLPDATVLQTPDFHAVDRRGLSRSVMRVSFRENDDFAGWLSTYFHVTSVFGSNGPSAQEHQTDRYTGADCADVMVGAMRASGHRTMAYTSVAGIGEYAAPVTEVLYVNEQGFYNHTHEAISLRWNTHVHRGDLVTIDYADDPSNSLPRTWDHIAALLGPLPHSSSDVLSPRDLIRHMGGHGLEDTPLVHAGPMRVVFWRWINRLR
jgi:hypothetical protein